MERIGIARALFTLRRVFPLQCSLILSLGYRPIMDTFDPPKLANFICINSTPLTYFCLADTKLKVHYVYKICRLKIELVTSVTWWLECFAILGHLQNRKFAKQLIIKPSNICQRFWKNSQSWEISPNLFTLDVSHSGGENKFQSSGVELNLRPQRPDFQSGKVLRSRGRDQDHAKSK